MVKMMSREYLRISELAERYGITNQMLYLLVNEKRIEYIKQDRKIYIKEDSYKKYLDNRWNRDKTKYKGKLVHNNKKFEYSVRQIADMLGLQKQQIYYFIYHGRVPFKKKGSHIVLNPKDFAL